MTNDLSASERHELVALFNAGKYRDLELAANRLAKRVPRSGFVWKVLGVALQSQGKQALPALKKAAELLNGDAEAQNNLGVAQLSMGRSRDAAASFRRAVEIAPEFALAYSNLGNALQDMRDRTAAAAAYKQALALAPNFAEGHCNLATLLVEDGEADLAAAACQRAIQLKPAYAEAHNTLGSAQIELCQPEAAIESYQSAIALNPNYAEAWNNLANALHLVGRINDAIAACEQALRIRPAYGRALDNLAIFMLERGEPMSAFEKIVASLRLGATESAKQAFVSCVAHIKLSDASREIRGFTECALREPWGRPGDLAGFAMNLIKLDPNIRSLIDQANSAWPNHLQADEIWTSPGFKALAADRLLRALLASGPIADIALERLLTSVRKAFLEKALSTDRGESLDTGLLGFLVGLSSQCFINEYVFACTDEETKRVAELRSFLAGTLQQGGRIPHVTLAVAATYQSLYDLPEAGRLLQRKWSAEIETLITQQIREPLEEAKIRTAIPQLTAIDDVVSREVKEQYEDNPYPRWISPGPPGSPLSVGTYIRRRFPFVNLAKSIDIQNPEILVAGCGTGRHAIETARLLRDAQVTAIDLSTSSIAYALRKTRELGLTNLEFGIADILALKELPRRFDIIESVGVLHHLHDPWQGWRELLQLLRPGGLMRIGLYSEQARRHVVRAREYIASRGYGRSAVEIRRCRQDLLELDKDEHLGAAVRLIDFFSTSACRDLLFHVQEHRFDLGAIANFLAENGLVFVGFELGPELCRAYLRMFPQDVAATDLACWRTFESAYPDTFIGMYQFWVCRAH